MSKKLPSVRDMKETIETIFSNIVDFRETLHRDPELSWQEFRTTQKIEDFLRTHDITAIRKPLDTGLIVDFVYDETAPFVMLRADIDALPIQDKKDVPYRSQNNGVCHACGHDAHTATMIGVALGLQKLQPPLPHNVRIVFQPAEEPTPSGSPQMIKAGALENVRAVLGLHMEPRLPLGTLGLAAGWVNMQSDRLDIELHGTGGHSARPNETADLLWIASRIIQDSYQKIYRGLNLRDTPVILTFTEINAGQGYNIIPTDLKLTGTLRFSDPNKREIFMERFKNYLKFLEKDNGCEIKLTHTEGSPAIFNNGDLMNQLIQHLRSDFWMPVKQDTEFRTPGGDDFSRYCQVIPGAMVRIGVRTKSTQASLHDGAFDIPAEALKIATAFFLYQTIRLTV